MSDTKNVRPKSTRTIWISSLFLGLCAAILFTLWPEIDLYASGLFYDGKGHFYLQQNPLGTIPRLLFRIFFIAFCALCVFGLVYTHFKQVSWLSFRRVQWGYLVACLILGPGVLTNAILKENWGRARPAEITYFDSTDKFTPALVPSKNCDRNCSFVSGESSSIYMVFFALSLLFASRARWIIAGLVVGGLAGLMRIGMGGHFLSDVTFSGIFMMLTATGLYWLFIQRQSD